MGNELRQSTQIIMQVFDVVCFSLFFQRKSCPVLSFLMLVELSSQEALFCSEFSQETETWVFEIMIAVIASVEELRF